MAGHPSARLWAAEAVVLLAKSSPASAYPILPCCRWPPPFSHLVAGFLCERIRLQGNPSGW